jgi:hypothetical protein
VTQRTQETYLAFICQLETSFDLSHAAQSIEFIKNDIMTLNKRLKWQLNNKIRELKYVKLDQELLQLVVFINSSFVNDKNISSQISYVICLVDEINAINIIHWSSVKCKKIIRSVLVAELYAMTYEFNIETTIKIILKKILSSMISRNEFEKKISRSRKMISISRSEISLILCTNSKSLYDCLVRLSMTKKSDWWSTSWDCVSHMNVER